MILRISLFSSVTSTVGMIPSVVPASGSTAISGTGMKGAWDGSNHRVMAEYHCLRLAGDGGHPGVTEPCSVPDGAGCAHPAGAPGTGGPAGPGVVGGAGG